MAVVATTTYLYVDATLTQFFIQGSALIDRGPWSASTFYNIGDVVQIGVDQYYALAANNNTPPTGIVDENWSTLVVVEEGGSIVPSAGSDAFARALAEQALEVAYIGTALGSAAYDLAFDAYTLAVYGTYLAGTLAVDLAAERGTRSQEDQFLQNQITVVQGDITSLQTAITVEQGTRAQEDQVLANAIVDETGSRIAADAAIVAFVFGSIAVDLAAETGSRIAADASEAASRAAADQQIISIVETGTNVANAAYALAQLGTIPPPLSTLPDVSIPTPSAFQVLAFDGSLWVAMDAPSTIAPGAFTYFTDQTASGTLTYLNAIPEPSGLPEVENTVSVGGFQRINTFITPFLSRSRIDAGVWEFILYAKTSISGRPFNIIGDVYTRSISGVETYLFSGTTDQVTSTQPEIVTTIVTQGSYNISPTDKLVFVFNANRPSGPNTTASFYTAGTLRDSHVTTPLAFAHNDLGGLQGGAPNQFYHTTLDQNNALAGNAGTPSATNKYVTEAGLASTTNLAQSAFSIAQIGTNTGSTAYSTGQSAFSIAVSGSTTANAALALAQQLYSILGLSLAGTLNIYTSDIIFGKPTSKYTLINGVVTGFTQNPQSWEDFDYYVVTSGTTPVSAPMNRGSSWDTFGSIYFNNFTTGVNGTDLFNLYSVGTISSSAYSNGTGWVQSGSAWGDAYWCRFLGTDTFEAYGTGTLSSSGTEINAGGGWVGTAQCYSGSNRP